MLPMFVTLVMSKLSGWLNTDAPCRESSCRESKGGHSVRDDVRAGRREAAGDGGARSVQERARLQVGGRARGGAHQEHVAHVRDAGGVEAQRLVERMRVLPRVKRRAYGARRGIRVGGQQAVDDRGASSAQGRGSTADWEQGTHGEHDEHACDAGRVEAQRLVEA